jgi:prepilin-type N-terminal cleavage/methylation domain-containing protein
MHRAELLRKSSARSAGCRGSVAVRAFTLMEVLVVVGIVGTMAAVATPVFIRQMRDQRVARASMLIAEQLRSARARALGRGAAVVVRWNAAGASGSPLLETYEAVDTTDQALPVASCLNNDWSSSSATRVVETFFPGNGLFDLASLAFYANGSTGTASAVSEVCFTPQGRSYVRTDTAVPLTSAFAQMTGANAPRFEIQNTLTSSTRKVFVLPNGNARTAL